MTAQEQDRSVMVCVHCAGLVTRNRGEWLWVHCTTRLPRCVATTEVCVAEPQLDPPADEEFWA